MTTAIATTLLILLPQNADPDARVAEALRDAGLTPESARFDPTLLRFFETGEFTSPMYDACSESPWRTPAFARQVVEQLAAQAGAPSEHIGTLARSLGIAMRRSLLGNPIAPLETEARTPGALDRALRKLADAKVIGGDLPSTSRVPGSVQAAAALVLLTAERSLQFHKLAFSRLGNIEPVYRHFGLPLDGEDSAGWAIRRSYFSSTDVSYLLAGAFDLALAAQRASEWIADVPMNQSFEWSVGTIWGKIALSGGSDSEYGPGPFFLILDTGGHDTYLLTPSNRSPSNWASVVVDGFGNDKYLSAGSLESTPIAEYSGRKSNSSVPGPGGALLGYSILIDNGGSDLYRSHLPGLGSATLGVSVLLDKFGDDTFDAYQDSLGYGMFGIGIVEDLAGSDLYSGFLQTQGCGQTFGVGCLLDRGGNDRYFANDQVIDFPSAQSAQHNVSMSQGVGNGRRADYLDGHSIAGGFGLLADLAGDDTYSCGVFGQGVGYWQGVGVLWDGAGNDKYSGQWYAQGASAHFAIGLLADLSGNDEYVAPMNMAHGAGHDFSVGILIDFQGNDSYLAPNLSLGAGNANGIGWLCELGGDDRYVSKGLTLGKAAEAPVSGLRSRALTLGLFMDLGGKDSYPPESTWARDGRKEVNWTGRREPPSEAQVGVFWDLAGP